MFIELYCSLLIRLQPLSLAWADLHHTDSLWALFQEPVVEFRLGYPIFYLGTSKFSPSTVINDPTIPNYLATHYYRDQLTAILIDISKVSSKEIEVELNTIDPNQCLANPRQAINDLGVEKGSCEKHEEVKLCPLP